MTKPEQLPFAFGNAAATGAEDFLTAESNDEAVRWISLWPAWPYPALALYGPPGTGKTHLLRVWCEKSRAAIVDVDTLERADPVALLAGGFGVAIDGAAAVAGNAAAERTLFHLFNLLRESGRHLMLADRLPPGRWALTLPDLSSRLRAAPAAALGEPGDDLLAPLLVKLFADRQLRIGQGVVSYLLPRMERSAAAAHRLVDRLDGAALTAQKPITIGIARAVLGEEGVDLDEPDDRNGDGGPITIDSETSH